MDDRTKRLQRLDVRTDSILAAAALVALAVAMLAPFRGSSLGGAADRRFAKSDFGAFYCAALVMRTDGDPYRLKPLGACEAQQVFGPGGLTLRGAGIDPAPLPAYDLAVFAPLTFLPYRTAAIVWLALLACAVVGSAFALRSLSGLPLSLTLAVLAFADGTVCFEYGQEQPIVTLALAGSALALRASRDRCAVAWATLTFIEPQVGLPTMFALVLFSRARVAAVVASAALGALALAVGGWDANVEYLIRVLPVHAFSELGVTIQYSAATLLYAAHVPDSLALRLASVQYVITAGGGVVLAAVLARRVGRPAVVLLPAACAVTGGTFIHIQEIMSALPLALYLTGRVPASRPWSALALALLALPWPAYGPSRATLIFDAIVIGTLCVALRPMRTSRADIALALGLIAVYLISAKAMAALPHAPLRQPERPAAVAAAGYDSRLASTELARDWRANRAADGSSLARLAERAPTWLALVVLLATALSIIVRVPARTEFSGAAQPARWQSNAVLSG